MKKLLPRVIAITAIATALSSHGAVAQYNPGTFAAPVPTTAIYPTLPYVTPEMYGAAGNGTSGSPTDDHVAVNAATAAACQSGRSLILFLDKYYYMGNTTWNTTNAAGCNGGLTITGNGDDSSGILYKAGSNNTGVVWDLTGARFITASGFSVQGGTPAGNNSAKVVVLMGAANSSGFLFSGNMSFYDVSFGSFQGTTVIEDDGAEQIHFLNCSLTQANTGAVSGFVLTASGSTPPNTSAIATTYSPVQSMTDVHWEGAKATFQYAGEFGVLINFTPTTGGGVGRIWFDDYIRVNTPSGSSIFMSDNSSNGAAQSVSQSGGHRLALENGGGTAALQTASLGADLWADDHFDGVTVSGTTLTSPSFSAVVGMTVRDMDIKWNPNAGGSYSPGDVFDAATTAQISGIFIQAPVAKADILGGAGSFNSYIAQGTDGTNVQ